MQKEMTPDIQKEAERIAAEIINDVMNPPTISMGFDDAPEVDFHALANQIAETIRIALQAAADKARRDADAETKRLREALQTVVNICRTDLETHFGTKIGSQIRRALMPAEKDI